MKATNESIHLETAVSTGSTAMPVVVGEFAVPTATNDNIKIHNCSCADMSVILDGSVHLTVTSPPYNVGISYGQNSNDNLPLAEYRAFAKKVFGEVFRVTADHGRVAINIGNSHSKPYVHLASIYADLMAEIGFDMKGEIIWNKVGAKTLNTAWGSWLSPSAPTLREHHEHVLIFSKGDWSRPELRGNRRMTKEEFKAATLSIWDIPAQRRTRKVASHPAPFPVELPRRLIKLLTGANDLILDPFTGTGTTALAAYELGNHFVGFELEPHWVQFAWQRLRDAGYGAA
ncbi:m4C-methyltransferase [Paramagnetospirillum caucaseum]|uniref:Methyltransferase n=1 Tax=Paramagnetospirillum caucaseum TaxID=1244869 RepID=M2ZLK6_9PROT|nr:site-specific DNA-methyltransferase [Paramagnetospirillum caucaseum]EME68142.1 m4C-methyltransferase [Paramagnetospirillum caucaseum]